MISFITRILSSRYAIWIALAIAAFFAVRIYGNRQFNQGLSEGKQAATFGMTRCVY